MMSIWKVCKHNVLPFIPPCFVNNGGVFFMFWLFYESLACEWTHEKRRKVTATCFQSITFNRMVKPTDRIQMSGVKNKNWNCERKKTALITHLFIGPLHCHINVRLWVWFWPSVWSLHTLSVSTWALQRHAHQANLQLQTVPVCVCECGCCCC